jgi:preprotein translocase subunit SecA
MRDSKKLESFLKEKEIKNKQLDLRNLKKEVEIGANGTQEIHY